MNANEVRKQWVETLKSGQYKHGKGALVRLHHKTGEIVHCCLGVLCEMAHKADLIDRDEGNYEPFKGSGHYDEVSFLPNVVARWAGLTKREASKLVDANDAEFTNSYAPAIEVIKSFPPVEDE